MVRRFRDDGSTIYAFGALFFVQCPRCQACAYVQPHDQARAGMWDDRKLTCLACGFADQWPHPAAKRRPPGRTQSSRGTTSQPSSPRTFASGTASRAAYVGGPYDWFFRLPLYLQTPCCGEVLWAYNGEHLNYLEAFVAAQVRELSLHHNRSVASRLPRWMISAHNRAAVLAGIQRLSRKVAEL